MDDGLHLVPVDLADANAFVAAHHRHHGRVAGHKFSIGVADATGRICGVAIVGRPVSRMLDDGWTLEVSRCCTDGTRNAASMLYRAAWRAVQAMGYRRLVTYTLDTETGGSLRGAGFRLVGKAGGGSWSRNDRPRLDRHPTQLKLRWEFGRPEKLTGGCRRPCQARLGNPVFGMRPPVKSLKSMS